MKRVDRSVARRWARALLETALGRHRPGEGPGELARELDEAVALLRDHPPLAAALSHPALPNEQRLRVARAVCDASGASETLSRLLAMLIERERISWLAEIAALYADLWNAHRGVACAQAVSATPLDADALSRLGGALGRATGLTVAVTGRTDAAVMGGVLVRMAGKTFDGTVRSRLRSLRQALTQEAS